MAEETALARLETIPTPPATEGDRDAPGTGLDILAAPIKTLANLPATVGLAFEAAKFKAVTTMSSSNLPR
jgi:hypothetical protein